MLIWQENTIYFWLQKQRKMCFCIVVAIFWPRIVIIFSSENYTYTQITFFSVRFRNIVCSSIYNTLCRAAFHVYLEQGQIGMHLKLVGLRCRRSFTTYSTRRTLIFLFCPAKQKSILWSWLPWFPYPMASIFSVYFGKILHILVFFPMPSNEPTQCSNDDVPVITSE